MAKKAIHQEAVKTVQEVIGSLLPLYKNEEEDRADNILVNYPVPERVCTALSKLVDVVLPGRISPGEYTCADLEGIFEKQLTEVWQVLLPEVARAIPFRWRGQAARCEGKTTTVDVAEESAKIMEGFLRSLPGVRENVIEDVRAAYDGDPSALTYAEVQLSFPGLLAVVSHRIAHELYKLEVPIIPRIMSEWTHTQTGVDINPGAQIGHGFFIDHATGVVIGETAVIGNRVKFYQGVTIGAKSFPLDEHGNPIKHIRRHPTVEDDVVVYANATILGGDTVIGAGSTIGGNVFLMESVPPGSKVALERAELRIKTT